MSVYEEGIKLIDEMFGNGKDNLIALATLARELSADGKPRPVVRCVDAYYEDCSCVQLLPTGMKWQTMKTIKTVVFWQFTS